MKGRAFLVGSESPLLAWAILTGTRHVHNVKSIFIRMSHLRAIVVRTFAGPGGLLFIIALLVYFPGIWWGVKPATAAPFSHPWGTDELAPLQAITELYGIFFAHHPSFNPQYPPMQNVMQAILMAPYLLFLLLTGGLRHPEPLYPFGFTDPVSALRVTTYLARSASYLMAAGAVLIAYRTGLVLRDRLMGWISAILVLFLLPMVYYSRVSNVDMGALFWTAIGIYVFAICLRDGVSRRRIFALGVLAAIATATKDASWPAFFMMAAVLTWREVRWPLSQIPRERIRWLFGALLVAILSYLVASGIVFRPSRFIAHLHWITGPGLPPTWREGASLAGYASLLDKIGIAILDSMGVPTALGVIAGFVLCVRRRRLTPAWILPAMGIVVFVLFPARYVVLRFVIVIVYVLAFFAAAFLREAWESPRFRTIAALLLVLLPGWEAVRAADLTRQMIRDPRYMAGAWLQQHARPGDRILHFALPANLPPLQKGVRNVMAPHDGSFRFQRTAADPEFVILIPFAFVTRDPPHESTLAESEYQALLSGAAGYQEVMNAQAPSPFIGRPLSWVNPHIRLFARRDILSRR
jgi:4-amino-4-deoxy-L-arabinose transferase-like glycosyltransferase